MLSEIWSGVLGPDYLPIPDPGSRGQKGTGSRIRIRNTVIDTLIIDLIVAPAAPLARQSQRQIPHLPDMAAPYGQRPQLSNGHSWFWKKMKDGALLGDKKDQSTVH